MSRPLYARMIVIGLCVWLSACFRADVTAPAEDLGELPYAAGPNLDKFVPVFDPGDFVNGIDHPYLAFTSGKTFIYSGETEDGIETIEVAVTSETKEILGVTTTVVHDQVYLDGELIEDTYDWYAQDVWGNVWYLGEDSKEYEDGVVVSTEGSWEAGVDGAEAGIIMLADPRIGMQYYQEFYEDEAEDEAKVLSLKKSVDVAAGQFDGCLMTGEWTKLDPGAREFKFYAPDVGVVLELIPQGGRERVELVSIEE